MRGRQSEVSHKLTFGEFSGAGKHFNVLIFLYSLFSQLLTCRRVSVAPLHASTRSDVNGGFFFFWDKDLGRARLRCAASRVLAELGRISRLGKHRRDTDKSRVNKGCLGGMRRGEECEKKKQLAPQNQTKGQIFI